MDSDRFDGFVRIFGQTRSRRQTLRGLAGIAAVGVLLVDRREADAGTRVGGTPCTRGRQCRTGKCIGEPGQKVCSCSRRRPACLQPDTSCQNGTCQETCAYGASACETPTTVCGPEIVTCGGNDNCWAMPTTSGCCACSSAPGRSHRTCGSGADCVSAARCDPLGNCFGDRGLSCSSDNDCASLATCRDGECGGPICTTDDDCEAAVGPGTVCISGAELPCTAGGANICWTLCTGA